MKKYLISKLLKEKGIGARAAMAKDLGMSTNNFYQRLYPKSNCSYTFKEKCTIAYNMRFLSEYTSEELFTISED